MLFSLFIVFISFKLKSVWHYIKTLGTFYVVTLTFAGFSFALFFMTGGKFGGVLSNGIIYLNIPAYLVLLSAGASYAIIKAAVLYLNKKAHEKENTSLLKITLNGKSVTVNAFLDTGNTLCDPISKTPVVVCEYSFIKDLLPEQLTTMFDKKNGPLGADLAYDPAIPFKLIPYKALGTESGMLVGIVPDKAELVTKGCKKDLGKIIVGISKGCFPLDKEYNALINPQVIYH